jgi:hypothetical protein
MKGEVHKTSLAKKKRPRFFAVVGNRSNPPPPQQTRRYKSGLTCPLLVFLLSVLLAGEVGLEPTQTTGKKLGLFSFICGKYGIDRCVK